MEEQPGNFPTLLIFSISTILALFVSIKGDEKLVWNRMKVSSELWIYLVLLRNLS